MRQKTIGAIAGAALTVFANAAQGQDITAQPLTCDYSAQTIEGAFINVAHKFARVTGTNVHFYYTENNDLARYSFDDINIPYEDVDNPLMLSLADMLTALQIMQSKIHQEEQEIGCDLSQEKHALDGLSDNIVGLAQQLGKLIAQNPELVPNFNETQFQEETEFLRQQSLIPIPMPQ